MLCVCITNCSVVVVLIEDFAAFFSNHTAKHRNIFLREVFKISSCFSGWYIC